jgi:hypothetical protein
VTEGTVKVHEMAPDEDADEEVQVWVVGVAPLNVMIPIPMDFVNPDPVIVTELPARPEVGLSVMAGVVTVKGASVATVVPVYVMT